MKTFKLTLAKDQFEERDGKLYYKTLAREEIFPPKSEQTPHFVSKQRYHQREQVHLQIMADLQSEIVFLLKVLNGENGIDDIDLKRITDLCLRAESKQKQKSKDGNPKWFERAKQLRKEGYHYSDIVETLNDEGYVSAHGKKITMDHVRNKFCNERFKEKSGKLRFKKAAL